MSLALTVINGPLHGKILSLKIKDSFSGSEFSDEDMLENHAFVEIDSNLIWNIKCLGDCKIRIGSSELSQTSLIQGLVFHIGQTGFKVIEKPMLSFTNWEQCLYQWMTLQKWTAHNSNFFFFLYPVRITFISGPQTDEFFTISYGPRIMGFNNLDLNLKDPTLPKNLVQFYQVGESTFIENLTCASSKTHSSNLNIFINKSFFSKHLISNGDHLSFGDTLIELTILN